MPGLDGGMGGQCDPHAVGLLGGGGGCGGYIHQGGDGGDASGMGGGGGAGGVNMAGYVLPPLRTLKVPWVIPVAVESEIMYCPSSCETRPSCSMRRFPIVRRRRMRALTAVSGVDITPVFAAVFNCLDMSAFVPSLRFIVAVRSFATSTSTKFAMMRKTMMAMATMRSFRSSLRCRSDSAAPLITLKSCEAARR